MIRVVNTVEDVIIESVLALSEGLANKLKNPQNEKRIEAAMKDLEIDHCCFIEGDSEVSEVSLVVKKPGETIDEDQINDLKRRHEDFLEYVATLPLQEDMVAETVNEDQTDMPTDNADEVVKDINFYNEAIDALRKEAADHNIGVTATVESLKENKMTYLGYLPFPVYIAKLIAINALNDE